MSGDAGLRSWAAWLDAAARPRRVRLRGPSVVALVGITAIAGVALTMSTWVRPASAAMAATPRSARGFGTTSARQAILDPARPSAAPLADPDPRFGAIFVGGSDTPSCSASVLDAHGGDLILTAAHCLGGTWRATTFVPGFAGAESSGDGWRFDGVYLDPRWVTGQDPLADYAIVRVGRAVGESVESLAGGGLRLSTQRPADVLVTVTGYRGGSDEPPIRCHTTARPMTGGYLRLPCEGLVGGTSGAPLATDSSTVIGLIGGLQGGGCRDDVSYSPPFDERITQLLARAESSGPSDEPPIPVPIAC